MNSKKTEIAFSNRYLYYYASIIKRLYGFVIRRGNDQPDERYIGHIGEQPQRQELPSDPTPPNVHIPDLSAILSAETQCDRAATDRLQTIALPGQTLPLLPKALSFSTQNSIPTLSLIWKMDRKRRLKSFKITPSTSTVQTTLTANEMDRAQHNSAHIHHRAITFFHQLANRLQDRRTQRDPDFDIPDLRVSIQNQTPTIDTLPNQLAHQIVKELCILSGVAIGRWCSENDLPAIYETRDEIENIETIKQIEHPIVRRHEIRRLIPNTKKTERPTYHHGLGVSVYCPITDANNHYAHLMMQRQINRYLQHTKSYYSNEQLNTLRFQIQDMHAIASGIVYRRQRDLLLQVYGVTTNFRIAILETYKLYNKKAASCYSRCGFFVGPHPTSLRSATISPSRRK